jgi:hypothetical protein
LYLATATAAASATDATAAVKASCRSESESNDAADSSIVGCCMDKDVAINGRNRRGDLSSTSWLEKPVPRCRH